ncbi:MAG: hypothetical protein KAS72_11805 [Phycisphaerales bacterium]|nr:hypothetical protein [Phycisphaerales bacterium]
MRSSDTSFQQVKSLLKRLDSSIDEARQRRQAEEAVSHSGRHGLDRAAAARNPETRAIQDRLREVGRADGGAPA